MCRRNFTPDTKLLARSPCVVFYFVRWACLNLSLTKPWDYLGEWWCNSYFINILLFTAQFHVFHNDTTTNWWFLISWYDNDVRCDHCIVLIMSTGSLVFSVKVQLCAWYLRNLKARVLTSAERLPLRNGLTRDFLLGYREREKEKNIQTMCTCGDVIQHRTGG